MKLSVNGNIHIQRTLKQFKEKFDLVNMVI